MNIVLQKIEHKETKQGKPFVRAQAKPGGWVSIWDPPLIALVKEHGSGPYEAEIREEDDFKNVIELAYSPPTTPSVLAGENGHAQGPFREPIQIMRTDALRMALEADGPATLAEQLHYASIFAAYIEHGTLPTFVDEQYAQAKSGETPVAVPPQPTQERPRPTPPAAQAQSAPQSPSAMLLARAFAAYERLGASPRERGASLAGKTHGKGFSKLSLSEQLALVEALELEAGIVPTSETA